MYSYIHTLILLNLSPLNCEVLKGREFLYIDFVYPVISRIVYIYNRYSKNISDYWMKTC